MGFAKRGRRWLALDLGDKRTGVAVGDEESRIASPVEVIELPLAEGARGEALLRAIALAAREHGADGVVVGLPLNMEDASEGPQAKKARAFGDRVAQATGLEVRYQDERLTSAEADWRMAQSGLTRKQKKGRRDALAAAAMLEEFLRGIHR
jgi:putative Holliday junction resolvase